jgi:hypothetical protein
MFLDMKEKPSPRISDNNWICDVAFYTGMAQGLNEQNNKLQSKEIIHQRNVFWNKITSE